MRYIRKPATPPPAIAAFLAVQIPIGVNLDYEHGFTRKPELRQELVEEQYGLCGYTGAPVDERVSKLGNHAFAMKPGHRVVFSAHIEHLKPQSICQRELESQGKRP